MSDRSVPRRSPFSPLIALAVASMAGACLGQTTTTTGPAPAAPSVVAVATVEPYWSADQFAKVSGFVSEVKADIGDRVTKGQLLAVIDVPEAQSEVSSARAGRVAREQMAAAAAAAVEQARTALEVAKRQAAGARAEQQLAEATLKRQEELFTDKAATGQQMDDVRARTEVARATAGVAEAKIAAAEADLKAAQAAEAVAKANVDVAAAGVSKAEALAAYTRITAPFDGVVTRRGVSPGDLVQAATAGRTTILFTVQRTDKLRVACDLPEASTGAVRAGDEAAVKLPAIGGDPIRAPVTRVAGAVNPSTRTMRVEIELDNRDARLRPGMYAQVTMTPNPPRADAGAQHP
jgi:multidrug efflux pump subunit AcrA (membrane-fusion protein)